MLCLSVASLSSCATASKSLEDSSKLSLSVLDLEGNQRNLADYLGSPTLLIVWASWCSECLVELGNLNTATRALARHDIQVVAVAIQDELQSIRNLPFAHNAIFPLLLDAEDSVKDHFAVDGIPGAYLLAADGAQISLIDPQDNVKKPVIIGLRAWQSKQGYGAILRSLQKEP